MFSMYRSQKTIENKPVDFKALYLEERRLKQQFQKRAQIAELKYRKLAQSINKKCVRCMNIEDKKSKEDRIFQLKQFRDGLNELNINSIPHVPKAERMGKHNIIENFGVFGLPESMLIEPQHFEQFLEGELLYASNIPSITEEHAAKLCFPSGITPTYYSGLQAKEKAIEIMSSSCSFAKSFVMSFESKEIDQGFGCDTKKLINPENRLYAVCLAIQDFSLVANWETELIESEKMVKKEKKELGSAKVLSCQETDISYHNEKDCNISVSPRVYCIFSYYPFFQFYQQTLKAIVNCVKTERLVIYRESGCALAEADSHFFLERVKETYREISQQIDTWQAKITKQYELKLMSCQRIPLSLNPELCLNHYVQEWGLAIFNMFSVQTFVDLFTLIMLQEKVVFISDNPTLLTYSVHLFTQLVIKPFQYPCPVVNMLPANEGYFQALCPFVYGFLGSKNNMITNKVVERFPQIAEIVSYDSKKSILKKRPKSLLNSLTSKFKNFSKNTRRVSSLSFTQEQVNFMKDKQGICNDILKQVYNFLNDQMMSKLPTQQEVSEIMNQCAKNLKGNQQLNQVCFQKIKKMYQKKFSQDFFRLLLNTQIVSTYLFK